MKERKIKIKNSKVVYKEAGKGEPIIVLHGWGASSVSWAKTQEYLAKEGFQVFIPDLPGFGQSQASSSPWGIGDYANFVLHFAKN
jgi:pimeloyl-ACP methyl ester carboxylesterase